MKASDLIRYIVWYATQREVKLTTVRVVKFVYLVDLFCARAHNGKTLTSFPWRFVNYGPYCTEVMEALSEAISECQIQKDQIESNFDSDYYQVFKCYDNSAEGIGDSLPAIITSPLKRAIKKFGEDTEALLDYVYFETEPMEGARKGDLLDFSKARLPARAKPLKFPKLSRREIEAGENAIAKLKAKAKNGKSNLQSDFNGSKQFFDKVFFEALENMDEEDLKAGFTGKARISPE